MEKDIIPSQIPIPLKNDFSRVKVNMIVILVYLSPFTSPLRDALMDCFQTIHMPKKKKNEINMHGTVKLDKSPRHFILFKKIINFLFFLRSHIMY